MKQSPLPLDERMPLNGTQLKTIACVSMLIDHIGASCLENGVMAMWPAAPGVAADVLLATDATYARIYWLDLALRLIGRLAFPIYCFLLAEGVRHTHDVRRYALRLAVFALVSEVPFNAAFFSGVRAPQHQNVYFTLFFGICALCGLRRFTGSDTKSGLLRFSCVALFAAAAQLLKTDYGAMGVVLIAVFGYFREDVFRRDLCAGVLTLSEVTAPLALVPIHAYNGQRGHCGKWAGYAFYAFYPAHIALLALITQLVLRK